MKALPPNLYPACTLILNRAHDNLDWPQQIRLLILSAEHSNLKLHKFHTWLRMSWTAAQVCRAVHVSSWLLASRNAGICCTMCSYVYCAGNWRSVFRHLSRLAVGTVWWFLCTRLFDYLHDTYCPCPTASSTSLQQSIATCEAAQQYWYLCHVSGHVFLLVHCLLTISEELRVFVTLENAASEQQSSVKPG